MSVNTPEVATPQKPSFTQAFLDAPTPVKVLTASLYLPAVLYLAHMLPALIHPGPETAALPAPVRVPLATLFLVVASFLLGRGVARGESNSWRYGLTFSAQCLILGLFQITAGLTATSGTNVAAAGTVVALLLAPTVRRHCTITRIWGGAMPAKKE